jgi:hypothetical protein
LLREFVGVVLALLRANSSINCPPPFGRTESSNDGVCGNPRQCSPLGEIDAAILEIAAFFRLARRRTW